MAENQQYDIVFVVDNTGSMGSYINGVKNNVATFAKSLGNGNIDYRLGLVEYGDSAEEVKKHDFTTGDFTTDIDEFINDVNSITATGGDDYPEAGLEALQNALTMDPREGAQREFIVLTDASFHDNKD
ncbi:MAG: VWA domain-containing protein, partial [Selenomonadaceae bacterium]|nr:VWA domain-containing protein [Selenomonadaceae bacterium]